MILVRTQLKNSAIQGIGIFAAESIPAGTKIYHVEDGFDRFFEESALDAYPDHIREFIIKYTFPHPQKKGVLILEIDNGRFMNHSITPNTCFDKADSVFASVDIAEGEEITCNYHDYYPNGLNFTL